jgi:hypothetical protein
LPDIDENDGFELYAVRTGIIVAANLAGFLAAQSTVWHGNYMSGTAISDVRRRVIMGLYE